MHHSDFVHLHLHTQYSLLDGAIRHDALLNAAHDFKMPAVAVTDHGNIFGAVEFYEKAMKKGIKPIIGCETYVAPGKRTDKTPPSRGGGAETAFHLILLVKNAKGYRNLCKLLTKAYIEGFYYRPRIDKELLKEHNEGLIALSACLHGEVSYLINAGQTESAVKAAAEYKEIFSGNRFYFEIQSNGIEEQKKVNKGLIELGKKLDIPLVATNDCHYLRKEDARVHEILLCIQTGQTMSTPNRFKFSTDEFYVKSPEEMKRAFGEVPEAIANTVAIAERCNLEMKLGEHHLPDFPVPADETLDSVIEARAKAGLERRLKAAGDGAGEAGNIHYYDRLLKELKVIKGMGFSGYFLIVDDFIDYARKNGIPVGPGRGSAAGSLVAYSLGITNLDPIKHNLLFERFLNPDRISLPDIDIDLCYERRGEVIRYVTDKYGADNVGQIITFGQLKAKACIKDVGRALDMPFGDVGKIAKLVPNVLNITLKEALEQEPRLMKLTQEDRRVKELMDAAMSLEGLPRHASTHAAGVVISNKPLTDYLPLYMGQKDNVVMTQFAMKEVEKIGLVKFDFLGLKTLTVIDNTVKLVKANKGVSIDLENLPLDDKKTYELIANGDTNGVFQLESSGLKDLLRKLKPETFEDIVAAVALYRPGPLQSGMVEDFINRKHKKVKIAYDHPLLKDMLENTYGVMVYQEQVMEIAKVLAGYTPGDADVLRKAMGKKLPEEMVKQKTKFLDGARKKEIPPKTAEKIFELIVKFAGYGFNKSHSAAYALISFQTAFLKAHYPVEFMAALMTSAMDKTDSVVKYVNECREMGIKVAPPDINESVSVFTVSGDVIRFGLAAVKNVGYASIDEITAVRASGNFTSAIDFLSRVDSRKVNKKVVESLVKCGAFDFTGKKRAAIFASLDALMGAAESIQRDRNLGQKSIFDMLGGGAGAAAPGVLAPEIPDAPEWSEKDLLAFEKETLGFYLSSHPLAGFRSELSAYATCAISELNDRQDDEEVVVGGIVSELKEITTKKGDRMAFVRLEDMSGSIETTLFADIYRKAVDIIAGGAPIFVTGRLEKDEEKEVVKLMALEVTLLEDASSGMKKARARQTHIYAARDGVDRAALIALKDILEVHPGNSPVFLRLKYAEGNEVVFGLSEKLKISPVDEVFNGIKSALKGAEIKVL